MSQIEFVHRLSKIWGTEVCHLYTVQCFSRCCPLTSRISIIWELTRNANSWDLPQNLKLQVGSSKLSFNSPRGNSDAHPSLRPLNWVTVGLGMKHTAAKHVYRR